MSFINLCWWPSWNMCYFLVIALMIMLNDAQINMSLIRKRAYVKCVSSHNFAFKCLQLYKKLCHHARRASYFRHITSSFQWWNVLNLFFFCHKLLHCTWEIKVIKLCHQIHVIPHKISVTATPIVLPVPQANHSDWEVAMLLHSCCCHGY